MASAIADSHRASAHGRNLSQILTGLEITGKIRSLGADL
jgi:hypothetical protein